MWMAPNLDLCFFLQGSDIPKVTSDEKLVLEAGQVVLVFIVMGGMFGIGKKYALKK